jgi:hypothetical protein
LVRNPEGKKPLGRPNIGMDLRETEWEDVDWIHLAQHRDQCWTLANTAMNLCAP